MTDQKDPLNGVELAFPVEELGQTGMTMKEYYAASIIQGIVSNPINGKLGKEDACRVAFEYADEMVKAAKFQ